MNKSVLLLCGALAALTSLAAQADQTLRQAGVLTTIDPSLSFEWVTTVSGIESTWYEYKEASPQYQGGNFWFNALTVQASPLTVTATSTLKFFNTATGETVPLSQALDGRAAFLNTSLYGSTDSSPVELRFSNAKLQQGYASAGCGVNCSSLPGDTLSISATFQFQPGHFLIASSDPQCADLSCMTPGSDKLAYFYAYTSFSVAPEGMVPEASSWALALAGLACMGGLATRQRQRRG